MFRFLRKKKQLPIEKKESATSKTYFINTGVASFTQHDYKDLALEGYATNVIASKCINMIAKSVAYIDLKVFDGDKELEKHPLITLLQRPNELQSGAEFIESVIAYKLIDGNSYIEKSYLSDINSTVIEPSNKPPVSLYALTPQYMKLETNNRGLRKYYEFGESSKVKFNIINGLCNIIHIKTFNPLNPYKGLAPLIHAAYSIDQHNEAGKWNLSLLQNGARPSGVLQMKDKDGASGNLTDEQFDRLKFEMEEQYSGAKNSGKPMLLEGGLEWKEMSLTPRDMDFLNAKNSSARDIALAFDVPSQLLGIEGDSTYNNMQEANLNFWERAVLPTLDNLLDSLNNDLAKLYGDNIRIGYDVDSIEALSVRRAIKMDSLEKVNYLTVNEKRYATGYEDLPDGDVLQNRTQIENNVTKQQYIDILVKDGINREQAKKMARLAYDD